MGEISKQILKLMNNLAKNTKLHKNHKSVLSRSPDISSLLQGILDTTEHYKSKDKFGNPDSPSYRAGHAWAEAVKSKGDPKGLEFLRGVRDARFIEPAEYGIYYSMGVWAVVYHDKFYEI